jgi:hypothetical protein
MLLLPWQSWILFHVYILHNLLNKHCGRRPDVISDGKQLLHSVTFVFERVRHSTNYIGLAEVRRDCQLLLSCSSGYSLLSLLIMTVRLRGVNMTTEWLT